MKMKRCGFVVLLSALFQVSCSSELKIFEAGILHADPVSRYSSVVSVTGEPGGVEEGVEDVEKGVEKVEDEAYRQGENSAATIGRADLRGAMKNDMHRLARNFVPRIKWNPYSFGAFFLSIVSSFTWFAVYFGLLYASDRSIKAEVWNSILEDAVEVQRDDVGEDKEKETIPDYMGHCADMTHNPGFHPEVVLVFHHPDHPDIQNTKEQLIRSSEIEAFLAHSHDKEVKGDLNKVEELLNKVRHHESESSLFGGGEVVVSMYELRVALLQDLYANMTKWGFEGTAYKSIDSDEIFVCVQMSKSDIRSHLMRNRRKLQIRRELEHKMGMGNCAHSTTQSPPYVQYDPSLVTRLHRAGIVDADDDKKVYRNYYARDTSGSIASSKDCISMVMRDFRRHMDLDKAKEMGILVDWYPVHTRSWVNAFYHCWKAGTNFKQPVAMLNEYFGSRLAFIFAWNGHYCKALFGLVPLALVFELVAFLVKQNTNMDPLYVNRRLVMSAGVAVTIWSRVAANLWYRQEAYFNRLWEVDVQQTDTVRSSFRGELQPSLTDDKAYDEMDPHPWKTWWRRAFSNCVTLGFMFTVTACIIVWINMFEGRMNLVESILLTVMIKVFQFLYNLIASRLTHYEHHKFDNEYYNSYLWKQFLFHSVNNYTAFFYLALKQPYTESGCPSHGCLLQLRNNLLIIQAILSVSAMIELFLAGLLVKLRIMWEDVMWKRSNPGVEMPKRCYTEEQAKYGEFRMTEQIDSFLQLVIGLGFVLLFGGVAPLIIPFCFVVFAVRLRAYIYLLLNFARRAPPRDQAGIGSWKPIVEFIMYLGLFFNGFFTVKYSAIFEETPMVTKMTGLLVLWIIMLAFWKIIDALWRTESRDTILLNVRRKKASKKLAEYAEKGTVGFHTAPSEREKSRVERWMEQSKTIVESANFGEIPYFPVGMHASASYEAAEAKR